MRPCVDRQQRGFSIVELAVVLFVVALLLGSMLVPLRSQVESRKIDETRRSLELAREMLMGFAAANGYFPCPADASSSGREAPGSNHATGACPVWQGYLPAALLGFTPADAQGFALDAWGLTPNRIRYAIASHTLAGVTHPFTRANGFRSIPVGSFGNPALFHVCQSGNGVTSADCGSAVTLASNAVAVVWSVGANGPTGGTSVHEAQNPNPNGGSTDNVFVTRTVSNAAGNEFDDIVTWIPTTVLISRLVQVGQFTPAAQTAISPP